MNNLKRKIVTFVGSLAVLGGIAVATAPAATAAPTCSGVNYNGSIASTSCSGSGEFRLGVTCYAAWPWESTWTRYSGWMKAPLSGALSASCNLTTNNAKWFVERR